jgi:hypothetical protein
VFNYQTEKTAQSAVEPFFFFYVIAKMSNFAKNIYAKRSRQGFNQQA